MVTHRLCMFASFTAATMLSFAFVLKKVPFPVFELNSKLILHVDNKLLHREQLVVLERKEPKENLIHLEIFQQSKFLFLRMLPLFARRALGFEPVGKCGFRSYISQSKGMDRLITNTFSDSCDDERDANAPTSCAVGLFVYMYLDKEFRGRGIGDILLQLAAEKMILEGANFMIIVHDDKGSGQLIKYYEERGFIKIFDFLDKGMICRL